MEEGLAGLGVGGTLKMSESTLDLFIHAWGVRTVGSPRLMISATAAKLQSFITDDQLDSQWIDSTPRIQVSHLTICASS